MKSGPCALCSGEEKLEQSHIMPRFVYRELGKSTGVPDGPVRPLLCGACEDRLSVWESQFARDIFYPRLAGLVVPVKYGPWLLKFAASVCWRILENAHREGRAPADSADCLKTWQDFLRGRRPDVGGHRLHLLRGAADSRTVAIEVSVEWVYAKMGPLIFFGLIRDESPDAWSGTRIHLEGILKPRACTIPPRYAQYLASRPV